MVAKTNTRAKGKKVGTRARGVPSKASKREVPSAKRSKASQGKGTVHTGKTEGAKACLLCTEEGGMWEANWTGEAEEDFLDLLEGKASGSVEGGKKYDAGKPRYDLMPDRAERALIDVLSYGAKKYGDNNWQLLPEAHSRYFAACRRHLALWRGGESVDGESGLRHLAHAVCSLMFLLDIELRLDAPR